MPTPELARRVPATSEAWLLLKAGVPWDVLRSCSIATARRMDAIGAAWERAADQTRGGAGTAQPKVRKATAAEIAAGAWH